MEPKRQNITIILIMKDVEFKSLDLSLVKPLVLFQKIFSTIKWKYLL